MKLSRLIFIFGLLATITGFSIQMFKNSITFRPESSSELFRRQLDIALSQTKLQLIKPIECHYRLKWCRITTKDINTAFITTQKDPLYQITALQKISTTAKMNHRMVQLIDLAGSSYYATLQNN